MLESGVEDCNLVARFDNARVERASSVISSANCQKPWKTFTKNPTTKPPSIMVPSENIMKDYPFNLFAERDIVEDCDAVILPPLLTF